MASSGNALGSAAGNNQSDFFGQAAKVLTDLLNPTLWKRSALTILGGALILTGVILYTRPSAVGGAVQVVKHVV